VRVAQTGIPGSERGSTAEIGAPQNKPLASASLQGAVKMQWDTSDQIVIYQFANPQGKLILQVPREKRLNLSRQISQNWPTKPRP
jgi:hypothetical protein